MLPHRRLELFSAMLTSMKGGGKNSSKNSKNSSKNHHHKTDDMLPYLVRKSTPRLRVLSTVQYADIPRSLSPKVASFVSHNLELKDTAKKEARMKSCHDICGSFPLLDQIHMLERLVQISTVDLEDDDSAMEDEDEEVR